MTNEELIEYCRDQKDLSRLILVNVPKDAFAVRASHEKAIDIYTMIIFKVSGRWET